ncbi:Gamma-aminobutyric acid receptor subunit gamma-3 [Liparis tanakae]|uniref:Gamma-aminobutyric acid receptor subunit gamma-3 n=1 Tax=Liparis tanakae TaxID=230148 RepID=A0A4Z2ELU6_9TELE|nr:Gamma-aminobutyric acid receptor subunit gamma-3 [Liparis tanakae]
MDVPLTSCVSLLSLLPLSVKPTVIDVGIYVNSIGPVSSIDMVS